MGVHRHRGTRWNTSVEKSDSVVLEGTVWNPGEAIMASRSSGHGQSGHLLAPGNDVTAFGLPSPFADTPKASFCRASLNRTGMAAGFWRAPSLATSPRRVRARGVAGSPHEHRRGCRLVRP